MDREDFAAARTGFSDFKALVMQSEVGKLRMMGLAVATGHHVVNYVAHLEGEREALNFDITAARNGWENAAERVRELEDARSPAKVDLSGLTRYGKDFAVVGPGQVELRGLKAREDGDYYLASDVEHLLATPSPSIQKRADALRNAALDLLEFNGDASAKLEIAGEPPLYVLVGHADGIAKLAPSPSLPPLQGAAVPAEPVAYVNGCELDNILDDRTATIQGAPSGWRKTPLYAAPASAVAATQKLDDIEQYRQQMTGISVAAFGHWKDGDSIHPDYDTVPLRDVAKLYAKYDELFKAREAAAAPLLMDERAEFEKAMEFYYAELERTKDGAYTYATTRTAWLAWQARATLGASPSPKLPGGGEASGEVLTALEVNGIARSIYGSHATAQEYALARAIEAEVERRCRAQRTDNEVLRDEVLEEAARQFDASPHAEEFRSNIAEQIRALKSTPSSSVRATCSDRVRKALQAALILCETDSQRAFFRGEIESLANPAPAPAGGYAWISVDERLPEVEAWVNVLVDRTEGDFWGRLNKPRFDVYSAQLREIDSEGYASWQRWKMSDGGPMGSLTMVTHWMPLPAAPFADVQAAISKTSSAKKGAQ